MFRVITYFLFLIPYYVLHFFYSYVANDFVSSLLIIMVAVCNSILIFKDKFNAVGWISFVIFNGLVYPLTLTSFNLDLDPVVTVVLILTFCLVLSMYFFQIHPLLLSVFLILSSLNSSLIEIYINDGNIGIESVVYVTSLCCICFNQSTKLKLVKSKMKKKKKKVSYDDY